MNETTFPATIEVVHRVLRKKAANVQVILSDDAKVVMQQVNDEVILTGIARDNTHTPRHDGKFHVVMSRESATAFCRDLAERLGLRVQ